MITLETTNELRQFTKAEQRKNLKTIRKLIDKSDLNVVSFFGGKQFKISKFNNSQSLTINTTHNINKQSIMQFLDVPGVKLFKKYLLASIASVLTDNNLNKKEKFDNLIKVLMYN